MRSSHGTRVVGKKQRIQTQLGMGLVALAAPFALAACNDIIDNGGESVLSSFSGDSDSIALIDNQSYAPGGPNDPGRVVCDPFESQSGPQAAGDWGLAGTLYYLTADQPRYSTAVEYAQNGHQAPVSLFLNQLDVPTRRYDRAFYTQSGQLVTDVNGNAFYEYFGVQVESQIQLTDNDRPGRYQFAILSDDGAVIQMDTGSGMQTIVNNDGVHPTRMGCASAPVEIAAGQKIPMKLNWYQGPRYHISMILMMREWDDVNPVDVECGKQGNSRYFDFNTVPSTPTATYQALLDRGWKVLGQDHFVLPQSIDTNPCRSPDPVRTFITRYSPDATVVNDPTVEFEFSSNYTNATFTCSLDGGAETPCTSPVSYSGLADGQHQFSVKAQVGTLVDETGANFAWRVDTFPPFVTFLAGSSTRNTIQIDYSVSEPSTGELLYGLSNGNYTMSIPESLDYLLNRTFIVTGLTPRTPYHMSIRSRDQAGNTNNYPNFFIVTKQQ